MMKIGHIAIWTNNLEELKEFYTVYFGGKSGKKYTNASKGFESYFIHFDGDTTLEIMRRTDIYKARSGETFGFCHIAFNLENEEQLRMLTDKLRIDGYKVVGEPRITGDGFYESAILDPDGNKIELVCIPH